MGQQDRQGKHHRDPHRREKGVARSLEEQAGVSRCLIMGHEPGVDEKAPGIPNNASRQSTEPDPTSIYVHLWRLQTINFASLIGTDYARSTKRKAAEFY